jgi:hypothetical protein
MRQHANNLAFANHLSSEMFVINNICGAGRLQILPAAGSPLCCVRAPNRISLTTDQNKASSTSIAGTDESRQAIF